MWQHAQKLLADEDVAPAEDMSDEEVERQMAAEGVQLSRVPSSQELIAKAEAHAAKRAPANVVPLQPLPKRGRVRWAVTLLAAAFGALLVLFVVHTQDDIGVSSNVRERARVLRGEAQEMCRRAKWAQCESKLEAARALDPSGERAPDVVALRNEIAAARDGGR